MARMRAPERRRQLLEVAAERFAERGYRGTTTSELAAAAGVTEPILYRHFRNKLHLFMTLVEEVGEEVIQAWRNALDDLDDPQERLRVILRANPATHSRGRGVYRVIFQAITDADAEPEILPGIRAHIARLHEFVRQELDELQGRGAVRADEAADELAWLLVHVAIGYGMVAPLDSSSNGFRGGGRQATERLLEELLVPPTTPV